MEYNQNLPKGNPRAPVYCFGHKALPKQRGIITYRLSNNRLDPLAHAFHNAIFNTFRRCKNQFLYVVPPFVIAWALMNWASERSEYLNSKAGRMAEGGDGS